MIKIHVAIILLFFYVSFFFPGCDDSRIKYPGDTSNQITITQGVWGKVWFWEGNFQPTEPSGTVTPVQRDILIYKAKTLDSVDFVEGGMYRRIYTQLIATVHSNPTVFFQPTLQLTKRGGVVFMVINNYNNNQNHESEDHALTCVNRDCFSDEAV